MRLSNAKTAMMVLWLCLSGAATSSSCFAGGYALLEQSAEGIGVSNAGATAGYSDGSAVFFNPAAMSRLSATTISSGLTVVIPSAKFKNEGSRIAQAAGGAPLRGDNGPDGGVTGWVPSLYTVLPIDFGLTVGFSFNVPFGLVTDYSDTWVGRYSAIRSELAVYSVSPALSYAITDDLSIGAAVNLDYARAKITNAIDFGTIGLAALGPQAASGLGLAPQSADGFGRVTGDDFGAGATIGLSYAYAGESRAGISYRSPVHLTLGGDAEFEVPSNAQVLTSAGSFIDTGAEADLTLPESIGAGIIHRLSENWSLLGDITWSRWSRFDELRVNYASSQPDTVIEQNWDNTWRYAVGAEVRPSKPLSFGAGFAYDQDSISDSHHRTPRLPANDRYWASFGAGYQYSDCLSFNLRYAHIFSPDAESSVVSPTGDELNGDWDLGVDIVSAQFTANF